MQERELGTRNAGCFAYAASRDARMKATAMWSHYTQAERVRAERMKLGLELCYSARAFYINPREKFITIKIENPTVRDRRGLAMLEKQYEQEGIQKVKSDQGVMYRISKL